MTSVLSVKKNYHKNRYVKKVKLERDEAGKQYSCYV